MSITSSILKSAEKSIQKLFEDENLLIDCTYKLFINSVFNETLGYAETTFLNYSISAIKTEKKKFILPSPGEMGISGSQTYFLIKQTDMPSGYSLRDVLEYENNNYEIERITPVLNLICRIEVVGHD
jgi:hypothetical protein